jgi:hypothetical protein
MTASSPWTTGMDMARKVPRRRHEASGWIDVARMDKEDPGEVAWRLEGWLRWGRTPAGV